MERILLIEDEQQLKIVYRRFLEVAGYQVVTLSSGFNLSDIMQTESIDLIITDIIMPDGDGIDVLRQIRKLPTPPPVIAITGGGRYLDGKELLEMAYSLGASAALHKPFTQAALLEVVSQVLARSGACKQD